MNFSTVGVTVGLVRCILLSDNFTGEWLLVTPVWLLASFVSDSGAGVTDVVTGYVVGSVTG